MGGGVIYADEYLYGDTHTGTFSEEADRFMERLDERLMRKTLETVIVPDERYAGLNRAQRRAAISKETKAARRERKQALRRAGK